VLRFQCPACQKVLKAPEAAAGQKVPCPRCGQRLLVPAQVPVSTTDRNKTVLGQPVQSAAAALPVPPATRPPGPVLPAGKVLVSCPGCERSILLPTNELSWTIECSQCSTRFVPVPATASVAAPAPVPLPGAEGGGTRANDTAGRALDEATAPVRGLFWHRLKVRLRSWTPTGTCELASPAPILLSREDRRLRRRS
jgi:DNA-directed RNA polymerase subunit RPC12/RpoP